MASRAGELPGVATVLGAQIRYQVTLLVRTPRAFILALLIPGVLLALEVQVKRSDSHVATSILVAQVSGLAVFGTLSIAYLIYTSGLVIARETGVLRRWHAMPLPTGAYFAGRIIAFVILADISGAVLLLVGVAMAGLPLTAGGCVSLLLADTIGAVSLASLGTAITPLISSPQGASPVLSLTYLPVLVFSGAFGALSGLPHWLTTAMTYLPVQPVIHAVVHALTPSGSGLPLMSARDFAVLAAWALGGLLLSTRYFRWDPTPPKRARHAGIAHVHAEETGLG